MKNETETTRVTVRTITEQEIYIIEKALKDAFGSTNVDTEIIRKSKSSYYSFGDLYTFFHIYKGREGEIKGDPRR